MKQCSFDRYPIYMGNGGTHDDPYRQEICPSCHELLEAGMSNHVRSKPMWFHKPDGRPRKKFDLAIIRSNGREDGFEIRFHNRINETIFCDEYHSKQCYGLDIAKKIAGELAEQTLT